MAQTVLSKSEVFISHSNEMEDQDLVYKEVIPKLTTRGIDIIGQENLKPGNFFLSNLTQVIDDTEKILLFVSPNSIKSPWCNLEMLIGLERSQAKNQLSVVLLLHEISEDDLPQIAVLQEAPKIYFTKDDDAWVSEAVRKLREKETIKHVMPAGNVAHGLVWSHFAGFLQYVLPELESKLKVSEWYKSLKDQHHVATKLYEMVPRSCACQKDLPNVDKNIRKVSVLDIGVKLRGGNERHYKVDVYSVHDGQETYYCMCEYPSVIETMKTMEDHHLAKFNADDKKLQLARFYYTMNSVLNHFDDKRGKARVLLFNDDTENLSDVLIKAIKEDLHITDANMPQQGWLVPKWENLESEHDTRYKYDVYVAHSDTEEDKQRASDIIQYLEEHSLHKHNIFKGDDESQPGHHKAQSFIEAIHSCRWVVFLMTKTSIKDKMLQWRVLSVLNDGIKKRRVRVIPVVDRHTDLVIPEALQWVTYVPYKEEKSHLKNIYNIVSGEDLPLKTDLLLPAGDVANGLAWGYVANYLTKVLPDVLNGTQQALKEKEITTNQCPKKLYVIIPKSCHTVGLLKDRKDITEHENKIQHCTKTPNIYPDGDGGRPYSCQIYSIKGKDLYFVGQYAAPVTCLDEMRGWNIAGVTEHSMESEAERFYEIVSTLMEQASPHKSKFCEFIFHEDEKDSLADIMTRRIMSDVGQDIE